jgi:indole-3-glycerol phosphate synthase
MRTILDRIIDKKRQEVAVLRSKFTIKDFEKSPAFYNPTRSLKDSIVADGFGIIAEIKRKSPSVGEIINFSAKELATDYQEAGARGISVLTDHTFFGGSITDLEHVKSVSRIPILRKDFIIDELQLFEAKAAGADAVLLIAEALSEKEALNFTIMAKSLGMEVLMEFHEYSQLQKINSQVDIIGVNNRNLKTQLTHVANSYKLIDFLPKDKVLISESGIKTVEELKSLADCGYHGALIGESILTDLNPKKFLQSLTRLNPISC